MAAAIEWQSVRAGLEAGQEQKLYFLRISPKYFEPQILFEKNTEFRSKSIRDFEAFNGIIINASFFGQNYQPLGLIINDSKALNPIQSGGKLLTAVLTYDGDKFGISPRMQLPERSLLAIQSGPLLFSDYKPVKITEKQPASRRSGICLNSELTPVLFITPESESLSLNELQKNIITAQIDCKYALNFDGGSSSQMLINLKDTEDKDLILPAKIFGISQVPVFLGFALKD